MTKTGGFYPIGSPGQPWGEAERAQWRHRQVRLRSYADDVVSRIDALADRFDRIEYGQLSYDGANYPLYALASRSIDPAWPSALITGGVHGYEISGVMGALRFLDCLAHDYAGRVNLLVAPCVSPWSYERVARWNREAIDPNRSFVANSPACESAALIDLIQRGPRFDLHIDLHETTDTDESEFRPALSARDGEAFEPGEIPDGFYLVADTERPQLAFQSAIITEVGKVTSIARPDRVGNIIGSPVIGEGLIEYPAAMLGLCMSITDAPLVTTTEIYPDAPGTSLEQCVNAQVQAIRAALSYLLITHARDSQRLSDQTA